MVAFGFPVGPIALLDEVGIDVGAKVAKVMHRHFGDRMSPPPSMAKVLEDGRLGRKNKRGFYTYDGKKKRVDETVYKLLPAGAARRPFEARDIQDRLVFAFLNEAALCLQDGVLRSPPDGDLGAIYGPGFPPFPGGPLPPPSPPRPRLPVPGRRKVPRPPTARRRPRPQFPEPS